MSHWQIGKVKITKIEEIIVSGDNEFVLPDAQNEKCLSIEWLQPYFMDEKGYLIFSVHGLIVDTGEHKIMVDTCIGNDKPRNIPDWSHMQTSFLTDMEAAGYIRDAIDTVLCTHLHVDHVGWNTMLVDGEWIPTFPNARYLVAQREWEYWKDNEEVNATGPIMADSIQPIIDAGLMEYVDWEYQLCPEVTLEPTPGHTPGHVSVHIISEGEEALITGDCMHHPVQIARPEWCSSADSDGGKSMKTREDLLAKYVDTGVVIIGTHFPSPTAGHVRRVADNDNYWLDVDLIKRD